MIFIFLKNGFSRLYGHILNCNHLINSFIIPTKNWRCHVMVLNHFYAKISFIHVIFWALHQFFFSGPECNFALELIYIFLSSLHQNYGLLVVAYDSTLCKNLVLFFENFEWINLFSILVQPCDFYCTLFIFAPLTLCLLLLVDSPTKPLSPGACTHWITFGSWNSAINLLSRIEILQNLH